MDYTPTFAQLQSARALSYTLFRSVSDVKNPRTVDSSESDLFAQISDPKHHPSKATLPLLKLARFGNRPNAKGSLRHDGNVDLVFGVEGDYDGGVVSPRQALERLQAAGIRAIIYTTPSHTAAAPRWRVLAILSAPVGPLLRHELVSLLNGALGGILAAESWVLSQTFYFGRVAGVDYEVHLAEGLPLDAIALAPDFDPIDCPSGPALPTVTRHERLAQLESDDATARRLNELGMVKSRRADGVLNIECPAADEHTGPSTETTTVYYLPHTGGYESGKFDCKRTHCRGRSQADFLRRLGFDDVLAEFSPTTTADGAPRFTPVPADVFANSAPPPADIVAGIVPAAELVTLFGESGSGKTFFALDLVGAVARGVEWRGRRVVQGRVVYVVAEGAGGFRKRLKAYAAHHGVDLARLDLGIVADCPSLFADDDKPLAAAIQAGGGARLIVIDTLAQTTAGANENSGEDMGKVLAHCRRLHRATGATVLLVHHAGKDASKGARGWSGVRAAVDAELEVIRDLRGRAMRVTKQKDGEDGELFAFTLEAVKVGIDDDGMPITSCVATPVEAPPAPAAAPKGKVQQIVMAEVHEMSGTAGRVPEAALIAQALARLPAPIDDTSDRRREVVRRAISALIESAFICREGADVLVP